MNIENLKESVKLCIDSKLTAFIQGSPGLGKSAIVKEIARERNLKLIDVRLAQCDITDLNGFPKRDGSKATYLPFDTFPVEGDPLPEGKSGWLLFLDELNSAVKSVQGAAYKLILDRMVGNHSLHPDVAIVAAGNLITDNAVVNRVSTALRSRLVNLTLAPDTGLWIDWGINNNLDDRILAYIKYKPGNLFNFDPNKDEETYACPRTWEMLSKILKTINSNNLKTYSELITSIVGNVGLEFVEYSRLRDSLPNIHQILLGSTKSDSSWDIGKKWMIIFHIIGHRNLINSEDDFKNVFNYINEFGSEFSSLFIKQCCRLPDISVRMMKTSAYYEILSKINPAAAPSA